MPDSTLLPYLRLVRFPAVFSALGDPLAGMLVARGGLSPGAAARAAGASAALYLGGMALNDLADREEDARERPQRPIPSGAVSLPAAATVAAALLGSGWATARGAGAPGAGTALVAAVLAYDLGLKHTPAGPAAMGACRALSLLLGAEAGGRAGRGVRPALVLGAYVAGLTLLARGETDRSERRAARLGAALSAGAVAVAATGGRRALPWVAVTVALAAPAVARALREPERVGPAVGAMIRAIPALDAALAAPRAPRAAAALALPLLLLTRWGRRLIPIT